MLDRLKHIFPILEWLPLYQKGNLASDLFSGITIGVLLIPQGMAYALIAGLPPIFGLYAAFVPQLIYALMGTSRQLSVGPVAMDSLLVAAGLGALSITSVDGYISMAILLAFMVGTIQLLLGTLKMGFIVNYLSKPVISGFTSAAAVIIGVSQFKHLFGLSVEGSSKFYLSVIELVQEISSIHWPTFLLGLLGILILLGLKQYRSKLPSAIIVVVIGILSMIVFPLQELGVMTIGSIPSGLPSFGIPNVPVSNIKDLVPIAATLALLGYMEAISIGKAVDEQHNLDQVKPNQELVALGMSNIVGSLFQSYPTSGGFSRTAVNVQSGAKTPLSSMFACVVVGLTLLLFTSWFYHLPQTILASIIIVAVIQLIHIDYPKTLFKTQKGEFILLVFTFLITLIVGIKEGIIGGIIISLFYTIYRLSKPHIAELGQIKGTDYFRNVDRFGDHVEIVADTKVVRFDSPLFFGNKDYFKTKLLGIIDQDHSIKHFVLDAEAMSYIDSTGLTALRQFIDELEQRQISFYMANTIGPVRDSLFSSEIMQTLNKTQLYVDVKDAIASIKGITNRTSIQERITRQTLFETKKYNDQ